MNNTDMSLHVLGINEREIPTGQSAKNRCKAGSVNTARTTYGLVPTIIMRMRRSCVAYIERLMVVQLKTTQIYYCKRLNFIIKV